MDSEKECAERIVARFLILVLVSKKLHAVWAGNTSVLVGEILYVVVASSRPYWLQSIILLVTWIACCYLEDWLFIGIREWICLKKRSAGRIEEIIWLAFLFLPGWEIGNIMINICITELHWNLARLPESALTHVAPVARCTCCRLCPVAPSRLIFVNRIYWHALRICLYIEAKVT